MRSFDLDDERGIEIAEIEPRERISPPKEGVILFSYHSGLWNPIYSTEPSSCCRRRKMTKTNATRPENIAHVLGSGTAFRVNVVMLE